MKYLLLGCVLFAAACSHDVSTPKTQSETTNSSATNPLLATESTYVPAGATMVGGQVEVSVPTTAWGANANGLLYLPSTYGSDAPSVRYPIIIHLAGIGQQTGNINDMITDGMCERIANGLHPQAVNPVDGKKYKFIVFSPQGPAGSWGWQESQIMSYMLPTLLKTYRIDTSRIYVTGYSAGGWGAVTFIDDNASVVQKIAAIAPVAPASLDNPSDIYWAAKYGLACWNIVGGNDGFLSNSQTINNDISSNSPLIAPKLTVIPNVGHSSWDQAYDPTWYDPADPKKLNIYEWFLQYKRTIK